MHKYLYVHGDPVQGVDPSGFLSATTQMISLGVLGGMFATTTAAVFQAAERGIAYGIFTGIVGGSALATAIGLKEYGAIRDGLLASVFTVVAIGWLDYTLGEDTSNKRWEYTSFAFEAFSWQTAGSLALRGFGALGDVDTADRVIFAGLEWMAQLLAQASGGLIDVVSTMAAVWLSGRKLDPTTEHLLRNSVKDTVANVAATLFGAVPQMGLAFIPDNIRFLRYLPPTIKGRVAKGLAEIAIRRVPAASINALVTEMGETLAEAVVELIDR